MDFDTIVGLTFLVVSVVSYVGYRYCNSNVYLKYKDQKVGK